MKDIGKIDIETYIRNLISEGFGHKSNDATCNTEQPVEDDQAEPLPTSMQSENSQKVKGNEVGS
jgi:hypothetical protein